MRLTIKNLFQASLPKGERTLEEKICSYITTLYANTNSSVLISKLKNIGFKVYSEQSNENEQFFLEEETDTKFLYKYIANFYIEILIYKSKTILNIFKVPSSLSNKLTEKTITHKLSYKGLESQISKISNINTIHQNNAKKITNYLVNIKNSYHHLSLKQIKPDFVTLAIIK